MAAPEDESLLLWPAVWIGGLVFIYLQKLGYQNTVFGEM
jgi:hypothetical protein